MAHSVVLFLDSFILWLCVSKSCLVNSADLFMIFWAFWLFLFNLSSPLQDVSFSFSFSSIFFFFFFTITTVVFSRQPSDCNVSHVLAPRRLLMRQTAAKSNSELVVPHLDVHLKIGSFFFILEKFTFFRDIRGFYSGTNLTPPPDHHYHHIPISLNRGRLGPRGSRWRGDQGKCVKAWMGGAVSFQLRHNPSTPSSSTPLHQTNSQTNTHTHALIVFH